jgi:signal transduction histidine kinase/CheY-like chemotaxis protein
MHHKHPKMKRRQSQKGFVALPQKTSAWRAYGVPLLLLIVLEVIEEFFWHDIGLEVTLVFTLPIIIAAIYFGFRPALLVTVIGGLLIAHHLGAEMLKTDLAIRLTMLYFAIGVLVSILGGMHRRAQSKITNTAHETDQRKDDFLAMLGHELRNPLSGISSAARLLVHPALDKRGMTENANIIHRQAAHMTNLISDLLDISRVTRGQVEIEKAPVNLVKVVHAAVEQVSALVEHREHRLDLNLPAVPVWVLGDKTRLVQVVTNLLVNAARYTPHKGVLTLTLSTTQEQAHLSVQDNGIGITPEMVANVFEIFVQAKRSTDGVMGGLGLGLSLVKSMAEAHGGKVGVYSAGLSHGSTFSVTLPLSAEARESMESQSQSQSQSQSADETKSLDILLVDDNRDAAQPLAMFLEFEGYRVVVAHTGQAALELAEQKRFDIAILDIGLPDTDGYTLARQFKAIPHQSAARLVAVTGYGTAQDIARAYEAGFDQHIVKPIDIDLLMKELEQVAHGGALALQASPLASTSG